MSRLMVPCLSKEEPSANVKPFGSAGRGFSLVELMVTMTIFGILMTGIFQAYIAQMQHTAREYNIAESDIDRQVGQGIIARDIFMAGYGLADDYNGSFAPWALQATNNVGGTGPDDLTLMGTSLGLNSQQAQHWSYVSDNAGADTSFTARAWANETGNPDARETLQNNDMVILLDMGSKRLVTDAAGGWLFRYVVTPDADPATEDSSLSTTTIAPDGTYTVGASLNPVPNRAVLYALFRNDPGPSGTTVRRPYYTVRYYLSDADGAGCASGVKNLLRIESRTSETPGGSGADQVIPCVADFQVALGLDTNGDRQIDVWQNGGVGAGYDPARLNRELRQVRVYVLAQVGERDTLYTYPSNTIQVGEGSLGRSFPLDDLRKYRWRVIRFTASPRNIR